MEDKNINNEETNRRITLKAVDTVIKVRVKYCHGEASGGHCCYPDKSCEKMCDVVPLPDQSQEAQRQGAEEILKRWALQDPEMDKEMYEDWKKQGTTYKLILSAMEEYAAQPAEEWVAVGDLEKFLFWLGLQKDYQWTGSTWDENTGHDDFEQFTMFEMFHHWDDLGKPAPPSNPNKK